MASIYSVGKLNEYIQKMFEQDYLLSNEVSVRGEVSNCKYHSTGHVYFSLKESGSVIPCVMFSSHRRNLKFKMQDGQQVVVKGKVNVFVRDGKYQLYASQIQLDGDGELYLAFEQLKARLAAEGMFDAEYKRKIPPYVKTVGVVAAPTGAVIRDIITVSKRRNPYVQVVLYPAIVQGDGAAPSIIRGIEKLEAYGADVIIVGRGGGTIEELWAFNEEAVAHAIFQCGVPVISAVGHETDFTIADFVADKRAATPTEAAEFAVGELAQTERYMEEYRRLLYKSMVTHIERAKMKNRLMKQKIQGASPEAKVREYRMTSARFAELLDQSMKHQMIAKRNRFQILVERVHAVSPVKRLNGGMAYLSDCDGKRISGVTNMKNGDELRIRMRDGEAKATIQEVYIGDVRGE
ncbi:MAG: exodeoxyribonuclease VII large subunit [Lachnospiraceae bacterium]|nr:exodeoxyribonuclease VII large subunit [Lachnospiraceae bacterium]